MKQIQRDVSYLTCRSQKLRLHSSRARCPLNRDIAWHDTPRMCKVVFLWGWKINREKAYDSDGLMFTARSTGLLHTCPLWMKFRRVYTPSVMRPRGMNVEMVQILEEYTCYVAPRASKWPTWTLLAIEYLNVRGDPLAFRADDGGFAGKPEQDSFYRIF